MKTKAIVNGEIINRDDLHQLFLNRLGITPFRFPQGNPYDSRAWPTLGWRGLVRHLYRRQKMWADLADQQYESEQHACLAQFLGIGERLFSGQYAELVQKQNRIRTLEFDRDQFLSTLDKVTREIVDVKELGVAVTSQSLEDAVTRLQSEIENKTNRRRELLEDAVKNVELTTPPKVESSVERLGADLGKIREQQEQVQASLRRTEDRLRELNQQQLLLNEELGRLARAETATRLFPKLKITHCPACDQAINQPDTPPDNCFLCTRPQPPSGNSNEFARRAEFEKQQIAGELTETRQLILDLTKESTAQKAGLISLTAQARRIEIDLRPVRIAVAAVVSPEVTLIDVESGRLQERLSQLERIRGTLAKRESLTEQINSIQKEVTELERQVKEFKADVDFDGANQLMENGFKTYLNRIVETHPTSWTQTLPIKVSIREREFSIKVGKSNWRTKLGGTQTLIFLLAYHYALMALTKVDGCHYPGFAVLDFQAKLDDGTTGIGKDQENFVVTPFIRLLAQEGMENAQLIVAGNAFEGLEGAHRIQLTHIWIETEM
ncbi:coiled-coil domain-containing protein [Zavarzinella formosa]|uniref:hypothetical protein n=1 Tax=Zavarzinella formosa TaxID=360055 RepID=UPI00031D3F51|nr:hypothetical protein [Zavarzinella formosa]